MMYITFLSAFLLSGVGAYYSIIGLTTIFMGAFWPVVIMGASLEFAKLVAASWLYRHWQTTTWVIKVYLTSAVIVLVLITSMGIFGFLAKSHIDSTLDNKSNSTELSFVTGQEKIINGRLNYLLARAGELAKKENSEAASNRIERQIQEAQKELLKINKVKESLTKNENSLIANIGPLFYIADIFFDDSQGSVDKAVRLMIFAIMFVFDPLAVSLVIAGNVLLTEKRKKEDPSYGVVKQKEIVVPLAKEPEPPVNKATAQPKILSDRAAPKPEAKLPEVRTQVAQAKTEPATSPASPDREQPSQPVAQTQTKQTTVSKEEIKPEIKKAGIDNQIFTKSMTHNDVVAAFKLFYDRDPKEGDALESLKGINSRDLLRYFYSSNEFLTRPGVKNLILSAANKIDAQKKQGGE